VVGFDRAKDGDLLTQSEGLPVRINGVKSVPDGSRRTKLAYTDVRRQFG